MTEYTQRTLTNAIDTYGNDAQLIMVLEEMSELQKEICKYWRGKQNKEQIAEEVADVEIMLAQVKLMFGIENDVKSNINRKVKRLALRIASVHPRQD